MPFEATCPHCAKTFTAPDHYEGKKGKCSGCGKAFQVLRPGGLAMADDGVVTIQQTTKTSKVIRLVGVLLFVAAIIAGAVTADEYGPSDTGLAVAGGLGVLGLLFYGTGQAMAWWNNG